MKEVFASKLWFKIYHPIINENAWYKLYATLQWTLYQIPILIEAIIEFDFQPWSRCSYGIVEFKLWKSKTDACWGVEKMIESTFQLEAAPILGNLQLLCLGWTWTVWFWWIWAPIDANSSQSPPAEDDQQEKTPKDGENLDEFWKNVKVQSGKKWENCEIFLFGSEEMISD